uniref:Homeobox protein ceh-26 n=1 Tax=Ascaris suum TaxID=6253 RepID=F1KTJ4_ASCSU
MSAGGALPQHLSSSFSQFAALTQFTHVPPFQAPTSPQRIKFKRSRQRVDAGEPRNSYQANRSVTMLQQRFANGFQFGGTNENGSASLSAIFPWMNGQTNSESSTDAEIIKGFDVVQDLSQHNAIDHDEEAAGSCKSLAADEDHDSNEGEKSHGEAAAKEDDLEVKEEKESGDESSPPPSGLVAGGSSSRRKNALPQRQQFVEDAEEITDNAVPVEAESEECAIEESDEVKHNEGTSQSALAATLAASTVTQQNKLQEMFEMQRRIYSNWMEQQKKILSANEDEHQRSQITLSQQQIQRDFAKLAQSLKQEILNSLTGSIDKVISDFAAAEAAANAQRLAAAQQQEREQHAARAPFVFHPLYHPFNGQSAFSNPFMQAASLPPTGIFPPAAPQTAFNPFISHLKAASPATATFRKSDDLSPFAPRKKRSKVTDCTRLNSKPSNGINRDGSLPNSARSSPQLSSYFPPTMVGHPLYGGASFTADERESPANSDDTSDCGPYDGNVNASSTLTPMHLRKAKLMFFYTRYPNSALLKSYFPDIRFNKNNTAQLVKWFSNFREFFYNQMDKYARNYLAEGVKNKEDIVVTPESEIYKNLNQHYNRNNHIQPPERLASVIQETLREFFSAIQNGRDAEPSWKKTIYKIINRMDDPIPEYFKDPNFLERLEG